MNSFYFQGCKPSTERTLGIRKSWAFFILFFILFFKIGQATTNELIPAGSLVLDMGQATPTINKSLKPYGLVYALLANQSCPVKWVINPNKSKDGTDFTMNNVSYRGGPFIITTPYRTAAVNALINSWVSSWGLDTARVTADITVPVYMTLTSAPRWTLDAQNGYIAQAYLTNAGIPASAYNFKDPSLLSGCDDLFAMPHADPTWATHGNLYKWSQSLANGGSRGGIYLSCHAGSVTENMYNPSNTSQQCNFLSQNPASPGGQALVLFSNHSNGSIPPPYIMQYPADGAMQFIGKIDAAFQQGSEQIFLPKVGWRTSTHVGIYDDSQSDIPGLSPGPAATLLYGYAKGDSAAGYVMMSGAHSFNKGSTPDYVNGQRAFMNWSYLASQTKSLHISLASNPPATINLGQPISLTANATGSSIPFSFQWTSTVAGTFSNPTSATTTFTPSALTANAIIKCVVTDACGRVGFFTTTTKVVSDGTPPVTPIITKNVANGCFSGTNPVTIDVLSNISSPQGLPLTVSLLTSGHSGHFTNNGDGTISYTPQLNFTGLDSCTYRACDNASPNKCSSNLIIVNIGTLDAHGCAPNQYYGIVSAGAADVSDPLNVGTNVTNPDNALDAVDGTFAGFATNDSIVYSFPDYVFSGDTMVIYWKSGGGTSTLSVSQSLAGSAFSNYQTFTTSSTSVIASNFILSGGNAQYIRLRQRAGTPQLDAIEYDNQGCVSRAPSANQDFAIIPEDSFATISVMSNDNDAQGLTYSVSAITRQPSHGKVSINIDNTITYMPTQDYAGTDNFIYLLTNSQGYSDTALVDITILEDGCAPGFYKSLVLSGITTVTALDSVDTQLREGVRSGGTVYHSTNYNTQTTIGAGGNIASVNRRHAVMVFKNASGLIPAGAFLQTATLNLNLTTGNSTTTTTLNLGVYNMNTAWDSSLVTWDKKNANTWTTPGGDFDTTAYSSFNVAGTGKNKNITYNVDITSLALQWFNGIKPNYGLLIKQKNETTSNVTYSFSSKEASTSSFRPTITYTYLSYGACRIYTNRPPLANPDSATTPSTGSVNINVRSNDSDPENAALTTPVIQRLPSHGTVSVNGDGTIKYTPSGSFNGTTSFTYRITDGTLIDSAMVFVTVTNAPPVAVDDSTGTPSGTVVTINVKSNDTDTELDTLSNPTIITNADNGIATINGNKINYLPGPGFTGVDSFYYAIYETSVFGCSGANGDTARVKVTVLNQAPDAVNDAVSTNPCQAIEIPVLTNDTDPENGTLTLSIKTNPSNGNVSIANGKITYTPNSSLSFGASDNFMYYITDNGIPAKTDSATVTISINNSVYNGKPVALDDEDTSGQKNQDMYLDVLSNDYDLDLDPIALVLDPGVLQPKHGTISMLNSLIKYVPDNNFVGRDTFEYIITDVIPAAGGPCPLVATKSDTALVIVKLNEWQVFINGSVYMDQNGPADGILAGPILTDILSNPLYITLVDSISGSVLGYVPVQPDGSYSLGFADGITTNTTLYLMLGTNHGNVGDPFTPEIPSTWGYAGEGVNGISDGAQNGIAKINLGSSTVDNLVFTAEERPVSHAKKYTKLNRGLYTNTDGNANYPNRIILNQSASDTTVFDSTGATPPGKLSARDADGSVYGGSTGSNDGTVTFILFPDSNLSVLAYFDGSVYVTLDPGPVCPGPASCAYWNSNTGRYEIPSFNPDYLALFLKNGADTVQFQYAYLDSANVVSQPQTYLIAFALEVPPPTPLNGTFTSGAPGNPANISQTVTDIATGCKIQYCDTNSFSCTLTPPALPTIPGVYIWCVKNIDTLSLITSTPCKFDTITILPPPPTPLNGTFTSGAPGNPSTIAPTVTDIFPGSKIYYCNSAGTGCTITAPALPTIPGVHVWCVKNIDTLSSLTSTPCKYDSITIIPPAPTPLNGTFTSGAPGNPTTIAPTVTDIFPGSKIQYCDINGNSCTLTPPSLPTAPGVYVWCVKNIDTVTYFTSTPCKYDTVTILPPAPRPLNGTFTIGAPGNPPNIEPTVTDIFPGSKIIYCDVNGNNCSLTPPSVPVVPGVYVWCVKNLDTLTSLTSSPCKFDTLRILAAPTVSCKANANKGTDPGLCTYATSGTEFDPTFTASSPGAIIKNDYNSLSTLAGVVFNKGTVTITWTVTDVSLSTATCSFTVTVSDNTAPNITCAGNKTVSTNLGTCTYTVVGTEFDPKSTSDNCAVSAIVNSVNSTSTLSGRQFPKGTTTVVWTVSDASGNSGTCSMTVTVRDLELPTIACISNQSRFMEFGICTYLVRGTEFDPLYHDNCSGATVYNSLNHTNTLNGEYLPKGTSTIVWTVSDASGNTDFCTYTVTVKDNQAPYLYCQNKNRSTNTGLCTYTASGNELDPAYSDNCAGVTLTNDYNSSSSLAGSTFGKGSTTITWTATDAVGQKTTGSQIVIVTDNQNPVVSCPGNQTRYITGTGCSYIASGAEFDPSNYSDNCGTVTIRNDKNFGSTLANTAFNKGITYVNWTATDAAGFKAYCSMIITVLDNLAPTVTCPGNKSRVADSNSCGYTVVGNEFNPVGFSDNCSFFGLPTLSNNINGQSTLDGTTLSSGVTTIVWTATDASGNAGTCSFNVTVTDNQWPTITCKGNQSRSTDNNSSSYTVVGNEFNPAYGDNCTGSTIKNNYSNTNTLSGSSFPTGTNTVVWTVTDAAGHATTCSFNVTVVDNVNPTISCLSNQTRNSDATACYYTVRGTEFDPSFGDNASGATIRNNYSSGSSLAGKTFPKGTTTVVWIATDASQNTAVCTYSITVKDNVLPTLNCVGNQTRNLTSGLCSYTAVGSEFDPTYSDNCTGLIVTNSYSTGNTLAGKSFSIGTTTVVWTATDASGNSRTCSMTVTVSGSGGSGSAPTCSISAVPSSTVNTGGVSTNLYIGYGAQYDTLVANASGGTSFTYLWSGSPFLSNTTSQKAVFTPTSAVNATLTCRVTNNCGYSNTCTITICVKDIRDVNNSANVWVCHKTAGLLTATFSDLSVAATSVTTHLGHGDRLGKCSQACGAASKTAGNDIDVISLGNEYGDLNIMLKPNPYNDVFTLSYVSTSNEQVNIEVYDMAGRLVESATSTGFENSVSLGKDLAGGMYTINFTQGNSRKVLKVSKVN